MKAATIFHPAFRLLTISFLVSCFALLLEQAQAQNSGNQENTYLESSEKYSREELAQMLAPIALYPDALLSQILMASTYPIEVIEADRWLKRNPELKDEALDTALLNMDWDPSVKAICHFPSIMALMSERITQTTNIGNAFLAQEAEVMDMVQELRAKAYAHGNLATNSQQKVVVEKETIIIEPATPQVIYVPYYDPFHIYGPWWYPAYPPYYWGPPGVSIGIGISYWPVFSFGFAFGTWSYFDWDYHYIYIDVHKRPRFVKHGRWISKSGRWHHHPGHRRGVAYRDKFTARKYGQYQHRPGNLQRDTRGYLELRDRDLDRGRNDRSRIDRDRRGVNLPRMDRDRYWDRRSDDRTRIERDRQERERTERARIERQRIELQRQERERVDRNWQRRQQVDQESQWRQGVERERQKRSRENVFNQVEDGRRERQSSERGRVSRQGWRGDSRGRGR